MHCADSSLLSFFPFRYNLINIKVNRAYYIYAEAPAGYLFTGGICNDEVQGWECPKTSAEKFITSGENDERRKMSRLLQHYDLGDGSHRNVEGSGGVGRYLSRLLQSSVSVSTTTSSSYTFSQGGNALGLREGRSDRCVTVDRTGLPDSTLDLGVMRVGDVKIANTEVTLSLNLDERDDVQEGLAQGNRKRELVSSLIVDENRERWLREAMDLGQGRYLLSQEDRNSIGIITAEVLASTLDTRLAANRVELDSIAPLRVILTTNRDKSGSSSGRNDAGGSRNNGSKYGDRLSVGLDVWGHYPHQLQIDFDYIVQDSINRDTQVIRGELKDYNLNCNDQTKKVDELGFKVDDFKEIHSMKGVRPSRGKEDKDGVFRTACSESIYLPEYFEESLNEINVASVGKLSMNLENGGNVPWVIIAVCLVGGLISLGVGYFLFQRGKRRWVC